MYVIKANGEKEKFRLNKIIRTCMRAGASRKFAVHIARDVQKRIYDNISTRNVLRITLELLEIHPALADKYNLKQAIMELGPSGFAFEEYFARILEEYGFRTEVGKIVRGKNVEHEVDISASKDNKSYMVECKYHNTPGIFSDLKVALYTYARFLDLRKYYDQAWLVTNTKCTYHAIEYAKGVNLKITSWEYPSKESLQELIERKKLFPVTILRRMSRQTRKSFVGAGVVMASDLINTPLKELRYKTKLSEDLIAKYIGYMQKCMSDIKC